MSRSDTRFVEVAPGRWFTDLGGAFIHYYRRHMGREEETFFPEAERVLGPEVFQELEAQVTAASDPLFDAHAAGRWVELKANLEATD